ncbi:cupin domain-containing protein [Paenibacillus nuruki]|uniref:cupin domain-containing protein n=1 Tax=Paenibacillus nuruki TaxID=1886670 RepID=UPI0028055CFA|nr:cupin domain-containing protein [Paenibacillus nuruki]CAJ1313969.1 Cupin-2 domain-containing protein [Paenibacillus nuruki]
MQTILLDTVIPQQDKKLTSIYNTEARQIVHLQLSANQEIPTHKSPKHVFIVVKIGKVAFTVSDQEIILSPNEVLIMEPDEFHSLKALEDTSILVIKS